jgi:hypothetical protein
MAVHSNVLSPAPVDLGDEFQRLAAEWKSKARLLSNSAQIAMLRPYQRIIGLGTPALPLILAEMAREPDHWFWALESITGENPVPPAAAGNVPAMTQAWLAWGQERGLVPR